MDTGGFAMRAHSLVHRFWFVPAIFAVAATSLAMVLTGLDGLIREESLPFLFPGGADGARSFLSSIASSVITVTGVVFSITVVVLSLTSSQFSPRALRTFLDDRGNQVSLGVFVATFLYALVVMRGVRGAEEGTPFVPHLAVTVAFFFLLTSVVTLIYYIHHIANTIQVTSIIGAIARDTRRAIDRWYPQSGSDEPGEPCAGAEQGRPVPISAPGVLVTIDHAALIRRARAADCTIAICHPIGTFLRTGTPVARIAGYPERLTEKDVMRALDLGQQRTASQDVGFGFRQLIDIAERALSPGVNDPTTAVQVIDQLHDLLWRLLTRPTPSGHYADVDGRCRLRVPTPTWEQFLDQTVDEIKHWGANAPRVLLRLQDMLDDLSRATSLDRQAGIRHKQQELAIYAAQQAERQTPPKYFGSDKQAD